MCSIIVVRIFINDSNRIRHPEWGKQQQGMVSFASYPLLVEGRLVLAMFARKFLGQNTLEALKVVAADGIAQGIDRKRRRRNWSD
jgi:hypothetical protein